MRKTEYAKMKWPERGKALFRHYCVFLLENPVFGMDGFILLAEREAFCNKFDRFYLKFLY